MMRSDLTADIVSWTGNNFNAAKLSSIIRLAEADIGRDVRIAAMSVSGFQIDITSGSAGIPADLLEIKRFRLLESPSTVLEYQPPNAFYTLFENNNASGPPAVYSMEGGLFLFYPTPVAAYTGRIGYLKRFAALVADADTNTLLNYNYDIYLFACLSIAFAFAQDDEQSQKYLSLYGAAVEALNTSDQFTARQGNALRRSGRGAY